MPRISHDRENELNRILSLLREYEKTLGRIDEMEKQSKIGDKLRLLGYKESLSSPAVIRQQIQIYREELNYEKEAIEAKEKEIELERKLREEREKTLENERKAERKREQKLNRDITRFNDFYNKASGSNFSLTDLGTYKFGETLNKAEEIRSKVSERVAKDYAKRGIADSAHYAQMIKEIDIRTNEGIKASGLGQSAESLQLAAGLLNTAGKLLTTFAKSALSILKDGINRQTQIYENTFHDISARTGMSRGEYKQFQRNTNYRLESMGLNGSVSVSENQEMLAKLVDLGMSQDTAIASALDNVITNKIVPYLDTTSRDFNLINNRLDNKFVKDIRGINAYNADIAGNNYLTSDLLNKIIDMVQPMSDEALQNLAQSSGDFTAAMNMLMAPKSEGGAGLSYQQAMQEWNRIYEQQNYAARIMSSGSTFDKLSYINLMERDIDTQKISNINKMLASNIDSGMLYSSLGPGYNTGNPSNNLSQSFIDQAFGIERYQSLTYEKMKEAGISGDTIRNMGDYDASKWSTGEFSRLQANETSTAKTVEKFWIENKGTTLATINETLTSTSSALIKTIWGIGTTAIGGKLASLLVKSLGLNPGTGIKTFLASGGGLALGVGATAAIPFLAGAITQGISDSKQKAAYENRDSYYTSELDSVKNIGDVESASTIHAYADILAPKNAGQVVKNTAQGFLQGMDIMTKLNLLMGSDPISVNKSIWKEATTGTYANNKTLRYMMIAFANSMLAAGNSPNIIPQVLGSGISVDGIKTEAHLLYNENPEQFLDNLAKMENNLTYKAIGPNGSHGSYKYSLDDMKKWGTFRQGLAEVPYDEYPALLHAGETVLTASTTAAINDMVMEYRNSQNQNYSLDAAIQNQTAQLIQKMDEIIHNMNFANQSNRPVNTVSEKLRNNMYNLTGTLAFQN